MITEAQVPDDILQQFQDKGFLLAKLPPTTQAVLDATIAAAQFFFRSPLNEKLLARLPNDLGYRGFAEEYSLHEDSPDQVESFSASLRGMHLAGSYLRGLPLVLYTRMVATIHALETIAEAATERIARHLLGQDGVPHHIDSAFRWWSFLQINYSLPSNVKTKFINDMHEDGCLVTVAAATAPGLEVLSPNGEVVPISTEPDEVVVFPGEILWLLSGGSIKPLHHQVRPHPSYPERFALLYFGDLAPDLCLPWIVNEVNEGVDIGKRVLENPTRFGLEAWTP